MLNNDTNFKTFESEVILKFEPILLDGLLKRGDIAAGRTNIVSVVRALVYEAYNLLS